MKKQANKKTKVKNSMKNKLYKYMSTKVKTISRKLNKKHKTVNPSGKEILLSVELKKRNVFSSSYFYVNRFLQSITYSNK